MSILDKVQIISVFDEKDPNAQKKHEALKNHLLCEIGDKYVEKIDTEKQYTLHPRFIAKAVSDALRKSFTEEQIIKNHVKYKTQLVDDLAFSGLKEAAHKYSIGKSHVEGILAVIKRYEGDVHAFVNALCDSYQSQLQSEDSYRVCQLFRETVQTV